MAFLTVLLLSAGVAAETTDSLPEGDAKNGAPLFKKLCRGCHGKDGRGGAHTFMPHVGSLTKQGYIDQLPDVYLFKVIGEGGAAVGKSSYMPAWEQELTTQEIMDVISHIRSLPTY